MIDEKDILINDMSKQYKAFLETLDLKIVYINEPISENNKNKCYIIEEYKWTYTPDGVYSYPSSNIKNASLVHLLSMPIETNPNLRVFQYWFTESFLTWNIAKKYIRGKDILSLIKNNGLEKVLLNYLTYRYNYDIKFQGSKYDEKSNTSNKSAELRQKFEGQKP